MLCKETSVENLLTFNVLVEDSGILSQPELPTTTLDITDDVLKEIEKCFTHTAYRKIWKSGRLMHWVKF